ncbi:MAG: hypothetical protein M3Y04_07735, partial [Actinomycetota bacterium]|nr:hypothetical protein [Actinomycetota bacterium]
VCEGAPGMSGVPVRLRDLLGRQGVTMWAALGPITLGEMGTWCNVGPQTVAVLIGAAVDAVLAAGSLPGGISPEADEAESILLSLVLHHERVSGANALRRALEQHAKGGGPANVRAAAAKLLATADRALDPRVALLDQAWKAAGDHRQRGVLAHRALRLDRRASTKELAHALGITDNRVAQIHARAERLARDSVSTPLQQLSADLRGRLAPVCRAKAVDDALAALHLPAADDPRSALLVWLAGPYIPVSGHEGWLATDPAAVVSETRRLLHEDGGVRQHDHVAADLEAAGVASADTDEWLRGQPVIVLDGLVVAIDGGTGDVAERMLSATGRAMTAAEMTDMSQVGGGPAIADNRLVRDPRFVRVDPVRFELVEWGSEPFAPAAASTEPPELFPRRAHLRIEVDANVLRGASDPVPAAVMEALGVPCGGRRTFTTRFGPVALGHKASQPIRGSVRPVALAAGAAVGDALVLEFDAATGDASVELVLASASVAS